MHLVVKDKKTKMSNSEVYSKSMDNVDVSWRDDESISSFTTKTERLIANAVFEMQLESENVVTQDEVIND